MKAIYGLYSSPDAAQEAVNGLRAAGVGYDDIAIASSEPLEEYEFGRRNQDTWLPWIAVTGAALGLASGYFLTSYTQQDWPLVTGGMPIVSNWTNLIVIFELTMLGAVLATTFAFLRTASLPSRLPNLYDPEVSDGKILVGVSNPSAQHTSAIERALRASGASSLKTLA